MWLDNARRYPADDYQVMGDAVLFRTLVAAATLLAMTTGALSQDGARAYFLLPADTDIASLTTTLLHSERGASTFDVGVITPSYRRSIDVGGNAGAILIGMPIGTLAASVDTGMGIINLETTPAQGDLFVGGAVGLLGMPSLAPLDYVQHKPELQASIAAKLFLPTGDYDSSRLLNMGGNRWSLQASLPISYVLGNSLVDPELTTFEIVPGVQFFGDNDDPVGPAAVSSQAPLWSLEGHVTHNLNPSVWIALDSYFKVGGETSADGVPAGDAQASLSLGATLGLVLSPSVALRLSYLEQVYSNIPNSVARGLELTTAFSF